MNGGLLMPFKFLKTLKQLFAAKDEVAPAYTYGTEDLVEGESPLAPGTLYFVYEEE